MSKKKKSKKEKLEEKRQLEERVKKAAPVIFPPRGILINYAQLYVLDRPFLRFTEETWGDLLPSLVKQTLLELGIEDCRHWCDTPGGEWFPREEGEYYRVVGSGRGIFRGMTLNISRERWTTRDYPDRLNLEHYEEVSRAYDSYSPYLKLRHTKNFDYNHPSPSVLNVNLVPREYFPGCMSNLKVTGIGSRIR